MFKKIIIKNKLLQPDVLIDIQSILKEKWSWEHEGPAKDKIAYILQLIEEELLKK